MMGMVSEKQVESYVADGLRQTIGLSSDKFKAAKAQNSTLSDMGADSNGMSRLVAHFDLDERKYGSHAKNIGDLKVNDLIAIVADEAKDRLPLRHTIAGVSPVSGRSAG